MSWRDCRTSAGRPDRPGKRPGQELGDRGGLRVRQRDNDLMLGWARRRVRARQPVDRQVLRAGPGRSPRRAIAASPRTCGVSGIRRPRRWMRPAASATSPMTWPSCWPGPEAGGADRVHLVGWSLGGGVAMQYTIDHPDSVASVTLLASMSPVGFGGTRDAEGTLLLRGRWSPNSGPCSRVPSRRRHRGRRGVHRLWPLPSP